MGRRRGARRDETPRGDFVEATPEICALRGASALEQYSPESIGKPYHEADADERDTVATDVLTNILHQVWKDHPGASSSEAAKLVGQACADLLCEREGDEDDEVSPEAVEDFLDALGEALQQRCGVQFR